nr:YHS domain-containing protein [Desulfobacterales bacterium]
MRFIILCILVYLGYRLLRGWTSPEGPNLRRSEYTNDVGKIDDVMVKDPFCQTYFPKRKGIKEMIHGTEYHFCSKACRDKFMEKIRRDGN